uniref:Uncharacterized protein n=1 Tax=Heterorhabditis bacteriophora TaxID=37862 RepID=A0A1I7X5T5_HETBA
MKWMRNNAMCESALSTTTVDFRRSRVDSKEDPICLQKSELEMIFIRLIVSPADDGTYHSSSAISLVNGERERFASTERVAQSAPSPVPSDAASDPPEGSGRKGRVRNDCERLGAVGLDEYGQSGCFTKQDLIKLRKVADVIQGRRMVESREIPANLPLQDTGANSVDRSAENSMLVMTNAIYTAASREGQLKERHRRLIEVTSGLRDELHFQQGYYIYIYIYIYNFCIFVYVDLPMLTSDSAAWTLCMIFNRRLEHCLSVFDPDVSLNSHIDRNLQGIRDLRDELAMVLPMLSEHTQQLGRWFTSVQDAFRNLDLILNAQPTGQNTKPLGQNIYTNSSNQRSVIVSQDLKRQEKLLAFQNYFLAQRREGDPPSDVPSFLHPSPLQLEEYTRKYFTQNVSTHRPGPSGISVYDVSRPIFDQQREQCGDVMAESKQKVFPPTHHQTVMENSRFPNTSIGIQRAPALFHRPSFHSAEILRGNNSEMIPQGFPGFVFKPPSVNGIESNAPPTSGIQLSSSGTGENQFVKSEDHQRLIIRFPSQHQQLQHQQLQHQQLQHQQLQHQQLQHQQLQHQQLQHQQLQHQQLQQQQLQQQQLQQQQLQQQQLQQQQLQQQQLQQQQLQQQQLQQQQLQQQQPQQQQQQQPQQQQQGIPVVASIERSVPPAERPAAPRGFTSKLSVPAIRLRIQQLRNICADDRLYPQELTYMLLLTGDLGYGANRPLDDGETFYTPDRMPDLFGDDVPDIDARIEPRQFFIMMRRRAIIVAGAIGYHFRHFAGGDINYNPPILPRLSMDRPRNELILRRVLGDSAMPCLYALLRAYNNGEWVFLETNYIVINFKLSYMFKQKLFVSGPISHRPQLDLILAFTTYLDNVALREGFQNDHKVEFIPDPLPSGRGQVGRLGGDDYILEDHEEQNNGDVEDDSEEEDDENNESEESEVDAPPPVAP